MNHDTDTTLRFYQDNQLRTMLGTASTRTLVRDQDHVLAEQCCEAGQRTKRMLASDFQGSILEVRAENDGHSLSYSAFGHSPVEAVKEVSVGFNGEHRDSLTGRYLLGNGYRAYSPALMRFNSPDSLSPFGEGGINAFTYCAGDPVNHTDPSGHMIYYKGSGRYTPYPGLNRLVPESMNLDRNPAPPSPPRTHSPQPPAAAPILRTQLTATPVAHGSTQVPVQKNVDSIPPPVRDRSLTWEELASIKNWTNRKSVKEYVESKTNKPRYMHKHDFKALVTDYIHTQWTQPGTTQRGSPINVRRQSINWRAAETLQWNIRNSK